MTSNGIWQVFTDTGDPLCWLLYQAKLRSDGRDVRRAGADTAAPSAEQTPVPAKGIQ